MLDFEIDTQTRNYFEEEVYSAKQKLKNIEGVSKGSMGLTPDEVKNSEEYKTAKANLDFAFRRLQNFNAMYVKRWAKEIKAAKKYK